MRSVPTLAAAVMLTLAACVPAQKPINYYNLATVGGDNRGDAHTARLRIQVREVSLPPYLDRSQIVVRTSLNRYTVSDSHTWLEQLPAAVARVLAEDIGTRLGTAAVYTPAQMVPYELDYLVDVDIFRLEPSSEGMVELDARWHLFRGPSRVVDSRRQRLRIPVAAGDYESYVAGMSDAIARLADDIAEAILARRERGHGS